MKQFKTIPWFPFLLVAFFILHGTVENFGFIYPIEILKTGVTILCWVALLFLITRLIVKNRIYAALICFFISGWLLFFGAIYDWVKSLRLLHWIHSYTLFIPFMLCTIVIFILLMRRKINLQNKLCLYLNVLLLVYCLYDLGHVIIKSFKSTNQTIYSNINFDTSLVKAKPNVYLLLFDEYPGYKSLKDSFAFSNDRLYQFLLSKDFKILPTFSNYNMTYYSMASMLNMHYIDKPFDPLQNTMEDDQLRIREIKNAMAIRYFKSMGYSFTNYSIFDILDQPSVKGNSFVISQATLLTHKIFFNKILRDLGWHFISGKYKIPFIEHIYMQEDRNNKMIEKELSDANPKISPAPKFVYAHFNMPHPPIFCDSSGNNLSASQIFDPVTYTNKQAFLSYLKFANKTIEKLVEDLSKADKNAIVIVMSDHGYRGYNNNNVNDPLLFDNFCAVRFPDKNYLTVKEKWSNVNFFMYLFNCEFNQAIPYLDDRSIFLKDKKLSE
ncbi:MAG: sulfatase-like hydrolase/transferase [Ferruginibacter sp.]